MIGQIRLAERRGLLGGGRPLSRVQNAAVELCLLLDGFDNARDLLNRFRIALVTFNPKVSEQIFPEWFQEETRDITEADLVDSTGGWRFEEKITPEEAQRRWEEFLEESKSGTLTLAQVEQGDDDGWI